MKTAQRAGLVLFIMGLISVIAMLITQTTSPVPTAITGLAVLSGAMLFIFGDRL